MLLNYKVDGLLSPQIYFFLRQGLPADPELPLWTRLALVSQRSIYLLLPQMLGLNVCPTTPDPLRSFCKVLHKCNKWFQTSNVVSFLMKTLFGLDRRLSWSP